MLIPPHFVVTAGSGMEKELLCRGHPPPSILWIVGVSSDVR
jgi:hypothetical protein